MAIATLWVARFAISFAATSSTGVPRTLKIQEKHAKNITIEIVQSPTFGPQRGPRVTQQISKRHMEQRSQSQPVFFVITTWHFGQSIASPSSNIFCIHETKCAYNFFNYRDKCLVVTHVECFLCLLRVDVILSSNFQLCLILFAVLIRVDGFAG